MQITVSLTVDLPATADVNRVEPLIVDAGRQAMSEALRLAALQAQAQIVQCPACGHPTLHADGTDRRVVLASFGRVRSRCCASAALPVGIAFGPPPPSSPRLLVRT